MKLPQRQVKPKEGEKLVRVTSGFRSAWTYSLQLARNSPFLKIETALKK